MKINCPIMLLADFYKVNHRLMYPQGTELVYSTFTPRNSLNKDITSVVWFGGQAFYKEYLIDAFNNEFFNKPLNEIISEYKRILKSTLGIDADTQHIEDLHNLGYLPLSIKALAEGTSVPLKTPVLTIQNTNPKFFWLTNFIESLMSSELWQATTSATIAKEYKTLLDKFAMETVGDMGFTQFQGHDFSFRGMSSLRSAQLSGMAHLTSFVGTDTIPAITAAEHYYNADMSKELIGTSIPATEHSIQCAYGDDLAYIKRMITEVHPNGFVSIVSDGYDFWDVIGNVLPKLKDIIMARKGGPVGDRVVIRPDSGDPVKIVCGDPEGKTELERKGAIEALWDIFGGSLTAKGYKLLDPHIGLIYGDSITLKRAREISEQLKAKGFASINCVYGIGSFTYQYNTRDTFGFALKSTLCVINGVEKQIFKDPKTDNGIKKSQKGKVVVFKDEDGNITWADGLSLDENLGEFVTDLLVEVFRDSKLLVNENFSDIRKRINS